MSNLAFLLGEVETWDGLELNTRAGIREIYERKQRKVQVALGLRAAARR